MGEARAQLKAFSVQRYAQVQDQLARSAARQSDALEARGLGGLQVDISADGIEDVREPEQVQLREVRRKAYQRRADDLQARRASLVEAVEVEVRRIAQELSRRRGVVVTVVGLRSAAPKTPSADLTPEVIQLGN